MTQIHAKDFQKYSSESFDNLEPIESLDLSKINDFDELAKSMSLTAVGGRQLGEAVDVTEAMMLDKDCFKVLTLSGAMTMAKMGLLICDMIDNNMVDAVISTGALMSHGFVESVGLKHYKNPGNLSDEKLSQMKLNRVYDTLEPEQNLDYIENIVDKVFDQLDPSKPTCSYKIGEALGKYLNENIEGRGIFKSAFLKKIPVYIPAFTDSEMGLDFGLFNRKRKMANKPMIDYNPFLDLDHYADLIFQAKKTGVFTIGGGVPRNWAQQVAPYLDFIRFHFIDHEDPAKYFLTDKTSPYYKPFSYAVRICPEPVHWGGVVGLHLFRKYFMGQDCSKIRRRQICRSIMRCNNRMAHSCQGSDAKTG